MGGNELRTPLEMALKREADGELTGGCIKCTYCIVVQGVAYCGISGKMLLPQFIDTPIRCKKRTEAMKMGLTGADLARLGPAAQRQVLEKVGILGKGGKKYHNQEDIRGRIHFDSRKEAARYSRPFSVGWYAVDHDRRLYRIREYYGCTGAPNTGVKMEPAEVAREIRRIEAEDPNLKGKRINRVGDPAIWGSDGTESIGALMERERVYFERGDHARIDGKMQVHHRLAFDEEGWPMLYVFSTCKHFIRTVPNLVYDEKNVEDIDTDGEDHIYDELRYVCMKNPISPRPRKAPPLVVYDPLDLQEQQQTYDRYDFYRRY